MKTDRERERTEIRTDSIMPLCVIPPSTRGNINSWTISHLGTEFRGLSQRSEHNGVQGNRHSVY